MSSIRNIAPVTITTAGTRQQLVTPSPIERYRTIRVEIDQSASTNKVFVGDLNVSSSQYTACLTLAGQMAFVLSGECLDPSRIWLDTSVSGTKVQVTLIQ